jgi:hypothetical protein
MEKRHPKATRAGARRRDASVLQIGSPEHDLRRLLRLGGFPEPAAMEPVAGTMLDGREMPWESFVFLRSEGGGARTGGRGIRGPLWDREI